MGRQLLQDGERRRQRAGLSRPEPHPLFLPWEPTGASELEGLRAGRPPSEAPGPTGQIPHLREREREKGSWSLSFPCRAQHVGLPVCAARFPGLFRYHWSLERVSVRSRRTPGLMEEGLGF